MMRPSRPTSTGPLTSRVLTETIRAAAPVPLRELAPAPGPAGVTHTPGVKVRTEAQQARIKRKFQRMKEKRLERKRQATQRHRLAKRPIPTSVSDAASSPQATPARPVAMEVDHPAANGEWPEEQEQSTCQAQPHQTADTEFGEPRNVYRWTGFSPSPVTRPTTGLMRPTKRPRRLAPCPLSGVAAPGWSSVPAPQTCRPWPPAGLHPSQPGLPVWPVHCLRRLRLRLEWAAWQACNVALPGVSVPTSFPSFAKNFF